MRRLVIALCALAAPSAAVALTPTELLYERTVMAAADARCRLFTPDLGAALEAARLQARGASLRSGLSDRQVAEVESRAHSRVAAVPCASQDLSVAASRVRTAFRGWRGLNRMEFEGAERIWVAERALDEQARWSLRQDARGGEARAVLGVAGWLGGRAPAAAVEGSAVGARLVMRHVIRTPRPRTSGAPENRAGRDMSFAAIARGPAGPGLRPSRPEATVFRFPAEAETALARLDARETVLVEFTGADGRVRRAWFEVGDFAAGQAFLAAAR